MQGKQIITHYYKKIASISLALILGLSGCGNSVFARSKDTGFTEKAIPVVRDSLGSSETATLRYYEDLPDVPCMSAMDFYNEFELAGTGFNNSGGSSDMAIFVVSAFLGQGFVTVENTMSGAEPDFSLARLSTFYDRAELTDYINSICWIGTP